MLMPPRRRRASTALIHVPRPTPPWTVVLHSSTRRDPNAAVVLYNPAERRLVVQRNANDHQRHDEEVFPNPDRCPLCRRPWVGTPGGDGGDDADADAAEDYMDAGAHGRGVSDAEYFGLLALVAPESMSETDSNMSDGDDNDNDDGSGKLPSASSSASPAGTANSPSSNLHASSFNQGYYDRFFVEERKLGRGLRGSVFLCQHVLDQVPLGQFAVKAIPVGTSHAWLVRMLKEVHLLERLRHPNITQYKHAWLENRQLTQFGPEVPCLFILMALANGGNLEEYIYVQWHPEPAAAPDPRETPSDSADDSDFPPNLTARQRAIRSRDRKRRRLSASVAAATAATEMTGTAATTLPHSATEGAAQNAAANNNADGSPLSQTRPPRASTPTRAQLYGGIGRATPRGKKVRYLSTPVVWCLFLDICKGLAHLHDHNIVHRDLKPPNLLLQYADPTERQSEIPRVLISDFGECEVVDETRGVAGTAGAKDEEVKPERTGATGTLEFMAPELLDRDPETGQLRADPHSPAADLWSLGVVLYFLCYADVPYSQIDDVDILRAEISAFRSVTFPDHGSRISPELQTLIVRLMSCDPRARPSAREILDMHGHLGAPPVPGHFQQTASQPSTPMDRPAREWLHGPSDVQLDPAEPRRDEDAREMRRDAVAVAAAAAADGRSGGVSAADAGGTTMALALLGGAEPHDDADDDADDLGQSSERDIAPTTATAAKRRRRSIKEQHSELLPPLKQQRRRAVPTQVARTAPAAAAAAAQMILPLAVVSTRRCPTTTSSSLPPPLGHQRQLKYRDY
ncbi:putative serine/threonine-protein kinase iks1 [Geranomyces variabilis]|nr:putative serine/threonine-protein kinase iks1 [Geranomyces variabilis]